jgi:hypothetical protein
MCLFCFDIEENPIIEAFVCFRFDIVAITNYNLLFFELFILWGNLHVCVAWGKTNCRRSKTGKNTVTVCVLQLILLGSRLKKIGSVLLNTEQVCLKKVLSVM